MKVLGLLSVLLTGGLLLYGTLDFPDWCDPQSAACTHVSPYYIERAMEQTSVPNIVTAVLADYRGYDTMFETTVIFSAAVACFFLLRNFRPGDRNFIFSAICPPISPSASSRAANSLPIPTNSSASTPCGPP